jgi:hypothetical protein
MAGDNKKRVALGKWWLGFLVRVVIAVGKEGWDGIRAWPHGSLKVEGGNARRWDSWIPLQGWVVL